MGDFRRLALRIWTLDWERKGRERGRKRGREGERDEGREGERDEGREGGGER